MDKIYQVVKDEKGKFTQHELQVKDGMIEVIKEK
jgi:hypothetical protein